MLPRALGDKISIKPTLMPGVWNRDSVLGIMTRLWARGPGFYSPQPFSVPQNFHIGCGANLELF
jgi:hypothetical protein